MSTRILHRRWEEVLNSHPNDIALIASGQTWTFAQLDDAAAERLIANSPFVYPVGRNPAFIFDVLAAWRRGKIVCPLEEEQSAPPLSSDLPECAHLKRTSGTTGTERFVAFTGDQLLADATNIVSTMGLRRECSNLGTISLAHSYGFSNLVLPLLLFGIPLHILDSTLPETLATALGAGLDYTLAAVPALWRVWNESGVISPRIKLAISAGAPLPLPLESAIHQRGVKVHNFYGSTECGGIAYDRSDAPRQDSSEIGSLMENVSASIAEDGCLEVRSAAVGLNYWPQPDARLDLGVFRTTDLAEIIGNRVYLRGRKSDLMNVAGRKLAPEEIERAILAHPEVKECLVFAIPEPSGPRGDIVVAAVVSKNGRRIEDLRNHALAQLPSWKMPREWWFTTLQTDQRGKLSRHQWREAYLKYRREKPEYSDRSS